jgi:hypothetical protein
MSKPHLTINYNFKNKGHGGKTGPVWDWVAVRGREG